MFEWFSKFLIHNINQFFSSNGFIFSFAISKNLIFFNVKDNFN